jgi:XRE family transcriptional regulator, regulator of sulfur utilization
MGTATKSGTSGDQASRGEAGLAVGGRIRALREAMDLSLRELADRSGVSAAALSQVERGESSPTLTVAGRIAEGLELSLSQLLRLDEGGPLVVVRRGSGRRRRRGGHEVEELTPPLPGQRADVSVHTLAAGASTGGTGDPPMHEPGSRETVVVLAGEVELIVEGEAHSLVEGDSATFDADLPHRLHNPGARSARLLAVVAAGLRRS